MKQYLNLLEEIKGRGTVKPAAREGMPGTISLFGYQFRHDLSEGFPLITTKGMYWKGVVAELLWFLRGGTNVKFLDEHGVKKMWHEDAYAYYCKIASSNDGERMNSILWKNDDDSFRMLSFEEFCNTISTLDSSQMPKYNQYTLGDCGHQYGKVWRNWGATDFWMKGDEAMPIEMNVDQLKNVLNSLRNAPQSRRHIVTAIDPVHQGALALYWCHAMFQFNCRPVPRQVRAEMFRRENGFPSPHTVDDKDLVGMPEYYLDCQLYQRSADVFLGVPFNIASYALLTEIMAQMCNMIPGEYIHTFGDVHIYENHINQVNEQLRRRPKPLPRVIMSNHINPDKGVDLFDSLTLEDFELSGYDPHPKIKAKLSTGIKK